MSIDKKQSAMENGNRGHQHNFLVKCEEASNLVNNFLNDTLPLGLVPERRKDYIYDKVRRQKVKEKIHKSFQVFDKAIEIHGLEEIAISYNGGKDCLVMLILLMTSIHKKFTIAPTKDSSLKVLPTDYKLDSIYINSELPFPNLSDFIKSSTAYYHLNPIIIQSSLKEGFEKYLNEINPKVKSIFVGIRYSDPYGSSLDYEQVTDHDWPEFLRIHPILHWKYEDIWDFLIGCDLDYCEMYDLGYTSLGGINTTTPNPYLEIKGDEVAYSPAYMLRKNADERERSGRISNRT